MTGARSTVLFELNDTLDTGGIYSTSSYQPMGAGQAYSNYTADLAAAEGASPHAPIERRSAWAARAGAGRERARAARQCARMRVS